MLASKAEAARTPSGPPPIPTNMSTLNLLSVTYKAPETYMHKLAVGKNIEKGVVDLDYSLEKNLKNLADAKNKELSDLTVCFFR